MISGLEGRIPAWVGRIACDAGARARYQVPSEKHPFSRGGASGKVGADCANRPVSRHVYSRAETTRKKSLVPVDRAQPIYRIDKSRLGSSRYAGASFSGFFCRPILGRLKLFGNLVSGSLVILPRPYWQLAGRSMVRNRHGQSRKAPQTLQVAHEPIWWGRPAVGKHISN
jgi:hypothetical protein